MGDRCTGHCCESFPLPYGETLEELDFFLRTFAFDGVFVAEMIIPLYPLVAGAKFPNGEIVTPERAGGWVFTCKHFDRENRVCAAYSKRPLMCRDFPYGKPCDRGDQCEWDKGRAGEHPSRLVLHEDSKLADSTTHRRVHLKVIDENNPPLLTKGPS